MSLDPITFESARDASYAQLYDYFVDCEKRQIPPKIKSIKEILNRTDTTVYGRIRRHWNTFIFENPEKPAHPEYVVRGLSKQCPKKYFVLAHKYRQAKYFYLFQTAIEKHDKHRENLKQWRRRKEQVRQGELPFEEVELDVGDGIPPRLDDEGHKYPEDPAALESEISVDEEEKLDEEEENERGSNAEEGMKGSLTGDTTYASFKDTFFQSVWEKGMYAPAFCVIGIAVVIFAVFKYSRRQHRLQRLAAI